MEKKYLNVRELSLYLGLSVDTVYAWIHLRKLPFYKVGRRPRFEINEINRWMEQRKFEPIN